MLTGHVPHVGEISEEHCRVKLKNLAHKQTAGKRTTLSEQFASPYCAPASSMSSDLCVIPVKLLILTQAASRAYSQKLAAATTWRKAQVAKRQMAQMPPKSADGARA